MSKLYPLKFVPIYMERIWGGKMMGEKLNRTLPESKEPIGESWEIVDRSDAQSVVANGELQGMQLEELMKNFRAELLGPKGEMYQKFPLLVKIIDAGDRLSLQVHPDEATCAEIGGTAEPKTEMWYILGAEKHGKILAGLSSKATRTQLLAMMDKTEVENLLQIYNSNVGDGYFITSGTMHAIGAGNLILEIQQNSDTTYRISDWGRVDSNGNPRELHVDLGVKSVNFTNRTSPKIAGASDVKPYNRKFPYVKNCPFFDIEALHLVENWNDSTFNSRSFHLISATDTPIKVGNSDCMVDVAVGETVLIPYSFGAYTISPEVAEGSKSVVVKTTL
ncbi:MAG: class I mannose-6-phosphate isomerase [Lentisphaeria bacterium]|nr:class I mannose-6-phosphate isomerase [Lentisphaeria bacterium]